MERRAAIKTFGMAAGLAAVSAGYRLFNNGSAAAAPMAFDPTNENHLGMAYRKLAWSGDESFTCIWLQVIRYGLVDSKFTHMWDNHAGILFTTRDVPGGEATGEYDVTSLSLNFYTEPGTGKLLETYTNPWTGKTVDVPYAEPKATTRRQNRGGLMINMPMPPGMTGGASSSRAVYVKDGEIWVRGDLDIRMEATGEAAEASMPGGGSGMRDGMAMRTRLMQVNDWFTYHGLVEHVMDPAMTNPPSDMYFNDINTWSTWLGMGDAPGNFVGRGFGRKVFSYADMPEAWRGFMDAKYPEVANDAEGFVRAAMP